jgi:pyruvate ferredoxin oxidoreductase beta subunit
MTAYDLVSHGVSSCAGCGLEMIIRNVMQVLGPNTVLVIPPGCGALFVGLGNDTAMKIPTFMGNLENSAACASGIRAGFEAQGRTDMIVAVLAGDGATVDIGLQSLSGMLERGDRVLYICYDNEAYMNTGIQSSGSTPYLAHTTTTPTGKAAIRKDMLAIVAAHRIPYAASATAGYLSDLRKKVAKGRDAAGPAYLHVHTPCPTGWFFDPSRSVEIARLAVQTGAWPLYEVENGVTHITHSLGKRKPVGEYLSLQGRFQHLTPSEVDEIQQQVDAQVAFLEDLSAPHTETHAP